MNENNSPTTPVEIWYTNFGNHSKLVDGYPTTDEIIKTYAKAASTDNKTVYAIKLDDDSNPVNPSQIGLNTSRLRSITTGEEFQYVNKDTFETYINFLKTNNNAIYQEVLRRMI